MSQLKKNLLQRHLDSETTEDTIVLAGREITVSQEVHVRADIKAARSILEALIEERTSCYITEVIKVIES